MTRLRIPVGVWIFTLLLLAPFPLIAGSVPMTAPATHWQVDGLFWPTGDLASFTLDPHCGTTSQAIALTPGQATYVPNLGGYLGCGVQFATSPLPDGVGAIWRLTHRDDAGNILTAFNGAPMEAVRLLTPDPPGPQVARNVFIGPIVSNDALRTFITTFPTSPTTLSLIFADGYRDTWDASPPVDQHEVLHEGSATLMIGAPTFGPWPDATVPGFVTLDDGHSANSITLPFK